MKRGRLKDSFNSSNYLIGLLEEYNFFLLQFELNRNLLLHLMFRSNIFITTAHFFYFIFHKDSLFPFLV